MVLPQKKKAKCDFKSELQKAFTLRMDADVWRSIRGFVSLVQ